MPVFEHGATRIHYEIHGDGPPVLLIAPGGMRSAIPLWSNAPWNPIEHLAARFRVIAMDQRNAGASTGPVSSDDGWHSYAQDQLALLDHLKIDTFATLGMCIGGPYCLGLAHRAPERVRGAVLLQPIGLDDNRAIFYEMFDVWADALRAGPHADVPESVWTHFRANLFDGPFLFNLSEADAAQIETPTLILLGNDPYHPETTSRTLANTLPNASLIEHWKEPEHHAAAKTAIDSFLDSIW
ncbi:MAG: alpha/beta hydrolase [Pseudomonadota bacterium]